MFDVTNEIKFNELQAEQPDDGHIAGRVLIDPETGEEYEIAGYEEEIGRRKLFGDRDGDGRRNLFDRDDGKGLFDKTRRKEAKEERQERREERQGSRDNDDGLYEEIYLDGKSASGTAPANLSVTFNLQAPRTKIDRFSFEGSSSTLSLIQIQVGTWTKTYSGVPVANFSATSNLQLQELMKLPEGVAGQDVVFTFSSTGTSAIDAKVTVTGKQFVRGGRCN